MRSWHVIMPVKHGPKAKSRLGNASLARQNLASAFAEDSVRAVLSSPEVARVVVVYGPTFGGDTEPQQRRDRFLTLIDSRSTAAKLSIVNQVLPGLNGAITDGIATTANLAPDAPCAVLLADIPTVLPEDISQALRAAMAALRASGDTAEEEPSASVFIPDFEGTGTVLLAGRTPFDVRPAFGADSAWAHAQGGARLLDLALPRLRADIDSPNDVRRGMRLGLGLASRQAIPAWLDS